MTHFFGAYRRLNIFLFVCGICPFLQNKQTNRFVCRRKYLFIYCVSIVVYFEFIVYMIFDRLPRFASNLSTMVRVLKFYRSIFSVSVLWVLIVLLLIRRRSHAGFFNKICHFDGTYNALIEPSIQYSNVNRMFWFENVIFVVYMLLVYFIELKYNEGLKNRFDCLYWTWEVFEHIACAVIIFHMKNCVNNLMMRIHRTNCLWKKFDRKSQPSNDIEKRIEYITHLYDILFVARDHLQRAFGSILILIFVYNMFAIALSAYTLINTFVHPPKWNFNFYYATVKFFGFELLLGAKDLYLTTYFHRLGNMVRAFFFN